MTTIAHEWLRAASYDLVLIRKNRQDSFLTGIVSFHAQQVTEKCLKALLEYKCRDVPKTHSLERLLALVVNDVPLCLNSDFIGMLDKLYIDARYPGDLGLLPQGKPTLEDVDEFYRFAESVFNQACLIVGVCESDFIEPQA